MIRVVAAAFEADEETALLFNGQSSSMRKNTVHVREQDNVIWISRSNQWTFLEIEQGGGLKTRIPMHRVYWVRDHE